MTRGLFCIIAGVFSLSFIVTAAMRRYALQKNLLDVPNVRSSHVLPTPRGGGIAIASTFFLALLAITFVAQFNVKVLIALFAGGGVIAIVGFLDDRSALSAWLRFSVHVVMALFAVMLIGGIPQSSLMSWGLHSTWIAMTIAFLALVWATNLFNFMDGIDGIAGSEAAFVSIVGALLNWHQQGDAALTAALLCLAAASSGFLLWNWPPARIFMGDVGSGFLGFTICLLGLAVSQSSGVPVEAWGILGGVFVVDSTVTLARRVLRGDRWFEAHRQHAYQHLSRRWKSHLPVTLSVTLINIVWLLPWAVLATRSPAHAPLCLIAALSPLVALVFAFGAGSGDN
jgi:Fuc2NAc and GlcNAc transferase